MAYSVSAYFVASFFYNRNAILLFVTGYFVFLSNTVKRYLWFFLKRM